MACQLPCLPQIAGDGQPGSNQIISCLSTNLLDTYPFGYVLCCAMRPDRHDGMFRAVADPTRRSILERLQQRELTVLELCEPFQITQPSLSKHLAVLRRSGLIVARRSGRHRYYRLDPKPLEQIATWAAQFRDVRDRSGHVWRLSQINQRKDT